MPESIRIRLMDSFAVFIDDERMDQHIRQSKKGIALMHYLILSNGQSVPNNRLLAAIWPEETNTNPENALKTLVSRIRVQLNQVCPGLGGCIVADRGSYHWECTDNMTVDVFEIETICNELEQEDISFERHRELIFRLNQLYTGDLLQNSGVYEWALARATQLHGRYIGAIMAYTARLREQGDYDEVVNVCRTALFIDKFEDKLHMELMRALIKTERSSEALTQYRHVIDLHYRYLNTRPSEDLQEFYKQIETAGKTLDLNLDSIRSELRESGERRGAFVCEYTVFKELFNFQIRNLERLGATMFLAVIMLNDIKGAPLDSAQQEKAMEDLLQVLRFNLRKGDTITRFSTSIMALLLPMVNYSTGNIVMERIKNVYYKTYPNTNLILNYRIGPLSSESLPEIESYVKKELPSRA